MINVEEQTNRIQQLYRQITGNEPRVSDKPVAPIPPDANPEQYVQENLQRLQWVLQSATSPGLPSVSARLSVFETEQEWKCAVEMPGVKKPDLAVQITQGTLRMIGTRNTPGINGEVLRPTYAESGPCRFERAVALPVFVRAESAVARLENGILTVRLTKDASAVRKDVKVEVA